LSPHPDDVAFSIGGLILKRMLGRPRAQTVIATVFTVSRYAPGLRVHHVDFVSQRRHAEDRDYARAVRARLWDLRLPDSSVREANTRAWFRELVASDRDLVVRIRIALRAKLAMHPEALVLAPLGVGGHVDHQLVAAAARELGRLGHKVVYYEDLPYAGSLDSNAYRALTRSLAANLLPVDLDLRALMPAKIAHLRFYASQIRRWQLEATRRHARRVVRASGRASERLWVPPPR
jgi:LmbE family N-acetylglucosaminyl deacetylase